MKRALLGCCGLIMLLPVLFVGAAAGVLGGGTGVSLAAPTAFTEPVAGIPPEYLRLFGAAGAAYGVPWEVLAGIGKVECDDGQDPDPSCTQQGAVNYAGAGGPMQFLAETWTVYGVDANHDGSASRWDPADAIYSAARYLKANGAPGELRRAIFAYNHSTAYVEAVLRWAALYEQQATQLLTPLVGDAVGRAVAFALAQRGVPYVYGGEGPGGYDCSGLVQAAYRTAGIGLPRTAQEQYDAGPHVPAGAPLAPGDLVFFGSGLSSVTHVGICRSCQVEHVGIVVDDHGDMVDAPHTGAVVRVEKYTTWSNYIGATRPSALATSTRQPGNG